MCAASKGNAVIGQSGGPTVVINQSLIGAVERLETSRFEKANLRASVMRFARKRFVQELSGVADRVLGRAVGAKR